MSGSGIFPGLPDALFQQFSILANRDLFVFAEPKQSEQAASKPDPQAPVDYKATTQSNALLTLLQPPVSSGQISDMPANLLALFKQLMTSMNVQPGSSAPTEQPLQQMAQLLPALAEAGVALSDEALFQLLQRNARQTAASQTASQSASMMAAAQQSQPSATKTSAMLQQSSAPSPDMQGKASITQNGATQAEGMKASGNVSGQTIQSTDGLGTLFAKLQSLPGDPADASMQLTMRERLLLSQLLLQMSVHSSGNADAAEMEMPVILNAGMIPGAEMIRTPLPRTMMIKLNPDQALNAALQLGIPPDLFKKLRRFLKKSKDNKAPLLSFISIFAALFLLAQRIADEFATLMEEEDEIREKLTYADVHGHADDRRRVYLS